MAATWSKLAYEGDVMLNTVADANSVLYAVSDNTPAALAMAASTFVARLAAGNVVAATVAEILTLLGVASGAIAPHDLLSAGHTDILNDTVTDGDVIIGNATPKWSSLAISAPAATFFNVLGVLNAETRPSWQALFDATVPGTIGESDSAAAGTAVAAARRDHVHGSPATFAPSAHALSAHTAGAAAISMGGYEITNLTLHQVADNAALLGLDEVVGKIAFQIDTGAAYILTALSP